MAQIRPFFGAAWAKFIEVNVPVADVGKKIGGKVEQNIASGVFQNACPIRMSYVLNYTGVPIPRTGYAVVSGADSSDEAQAKPQGVRWVVGGADPALSVGSPPRGAGRREVGTPSA